jgi:uncharacterized membrane protein
MYDNKLFVIVYSIFIGIISIFTSFQKKAFLKKYDDSIVLLIESLFIFIFLSIYAFFFQKKINFVKEVSKISIKDMIIMILIPLYFTVTSVIGAKILKQHDITYLTMLDTALDLILTAILGYLVFEETMNINKIIGIIFVFSGIFLMH